MDIKKLDKVFSEYIRRRDADDNGFVKCCTCPTVRHWKQMDAGHYIKRDQLSTRWDERNVYAQCVDCNRFHDGRILEYDNFIYDKLGSDEYNSLISRPWNNSGFKYMQHEIDELVEIYKQKIKQRLHN